MDTMNFGIDPSKAACLMSAIEEGTVRSAASRLNLEPSTVSRKISALEADLDIQLIERGRSGVKLTEAGELRVLHLQRQRSDVEGIAFNVNRPQQIKTLASSQQPLVMIAAKNSRFASLNEPVALNTAKELPCAILRQGSGLRAMIEKAENSHGVRFNITLETNSLTAIKAYVREGLGVSFLAEYVVTSEILDEKFVSRRLNIPEFKLTNTFMKISGVKNP